MDILSGFLEGIETNLHEAESYVALAAQFYDRAKSIGHLPTIRLCMEARTKAETAVKMFKRAIERPTTSLIADNLRVEGLDLMAECDWTFFDIEHAFRQSQVRTTS